MSSREAMNWVEANSTLTCTTELKIEWVGPRRLKELAPKATLGALVGGTYYVMVMKQSDRRERAPIIVHEVVHGCQRDSGRFLENTIDNCLARETEAHELDQLWREQHGKRYEPVTAHFLLRKCI